MRSRARSTWRSASFSHSWRFRHWPPARETAFPWATGCSRSWRQAARFTSSFSIVTCPSGPACRSRRIWWWLASAWCCYWKRRAGRSDRRSPWSPLSSCSMFSSVRPASCPTPSAGVELRSAAQWIRCGSPPMVCSAWRWAFHPPSCSCSCCSARCWTGRARAISSSSWPSRCLVICAADRPRRQCWPR